MIRRKVAAVCMVLCLAGMTGCSGGGAGEIGTVQQSETSWDQEGKAAPQDGTGSGFRPPAGSHTDKRGNIVDKDGNTFNAEGEWQVPEGGRVDADGRIIDKDGNVMGGGAKVGSKG